MTQVPVGKTRIVRAAFDDPPRLARIAASTDEAMDHYRRVRDEIRAFVESLPAALQAIPKEKSK